MKIVASNRRAKFDYDILDTVEAGVMLTGGEVKSCRAGQVDLRGSYVSFFSGKPVLRQAKIQPYRFAAHADAATDRDRPLLLNKREAEKLAALSDQDGITLIPIEVRAGKFIKVLIAVAKGRKTIDKRRKIKEKEVTRRLRRGEM